MKRLLTILILIFTLQTSSWADDIRDFQIEGISIGDSLLDYFNENEIKRGMKLDYYKSKKFIRVELWDAKTNVYDVLSVHIIQQTIPDANSFDLKVSDIIRPG